MSALIQPVPPYSMRSHRFHLLDGLRGLAAILVVLYHTPLYLRPHLALKNGWLAVDFFFGLSGFVIAFSYENRFAAGLRLRDFFAARLIRLYPLYLLGTALGVLSYLVVSGFSIHVRISLPNLLYSLGPALLMLPNLPNHWSEPAAFPLDIPAWSLASELVANALFALLLRRRRASNAVMAIVAGSSLLFLIALILRGASSLDLGWTLPTFLPALARIGYGFFAGVLLLRLWAARQPLADSLVRKAFFPSLAVGGIALLAVSPACMRSAWAQLLVIALLFPAVVFLGALSDVPARLVPACVFLGEISYPLYILHAALVFPLKGSKFQDFSRTHAHASWLVPVVCGALIAFAWAAGRFYDRTVRQALTRRYNAWTRKHSQVTAT